MGFWDEMARLEARIHTPEWRVAVEQCRERLHLPLGDEATLNKWLLEVGRDAVVSSIGDGYQVLRAEQHLSARFLQYFAACVLSHHGGGTHPHSLPEDLLGPNCLREPGRHPDPFFRHWFRPQLRPLGSGRWEPVAPPLGFEMCWPKLPLLQFIQDPSGEVEGPRFHITLNAPGNWSWEVIQNYVIFFPDGRVVDGPYLYGPAIAGKTPEEILDLPAGARAAATRAVVPLAVVPGLIHAGSLGPGAVLEWAEPFVKRDLMLEPTERRLAEQAEQSMERLWLSRGQQSRAPGRPRADTGPAPGASYAQRVRALYEEALRSEHYAPTDPRRAELRAQARRKAQREFPDPSARDKLPRHWWQAVDEADRHRRRGGKA